MNIIEYKTLHNPYKCSIMKSSKIINERYIKLISKVNVKFQLSGVGC